MEPTRNLKTLLQIMEALRDKETGCPWDIEQNFSTIAPFTIEEAYEVADAIERGDYDDLCDELGDLLLQVVYHSQLANETGLFEFGDVVEGITRKMIRRHPHVFGDEKVDSQKVNQLWENIKSQEREEKNRRRREKGLPESSQGILDGIPTNLPALTLAWKIQKKAARVGFDWPNTEGVLAKINEEVRELQEAAESEQADLNKSRMEEEFGDVLFSLVNLARHMNIDPEDALRNASKKFKRRFGKIEETAGQEGSRIEELSLDRMEQIWNQAKQEEH